MSQLWTPGTTGPLDQFVERLHRRVEQFAQEHELEQAAVEVELGDGALLLVKAISADPGFGFVTLTPYAEEPEELIVPVASIRRIELARAEDDRAVLGFSLPTHGQAP